MTLLHCLFRPAFRAASASPARYRRYCAPWSFGAIATVGCWAAGCSEGTSAPSDSSEPSTASSTTNDPSGASASDDTTTAPSNVTSLDACFDGLMPRETGRVVNVMTFRTADGAVVLRLAREPGERQAVGETFPYDLVRFGVEREGDIDCITNAAHLQYDFAHHNWDEELTAEGEAMYVVRMTYNWMAEGQRWTDTVTIDAGDELTLELVDCSVLPTPDLNHCLLRPNDE